MQLLLDVNVLVAWGWSDHSEHQRSAAWIGAMKAKRGVSLFTSAISQLGFVRVSVQRAGGRLAVGEAAETLANMLKSLGKRHKFVADDQESAVTWSDWCHSASRTTDAHLLELAARHDMHLATLDEGIPGAFLIPMFQSPLA